MQAFRQHGQDFVARRHRQWLIDSTRHHPGRVNPLPRHFFDNLLADLPQAHAVARHLRVVLRQTKNIPPRRVGIHAQQEIRRREMEETERVGLHNLRQVQDGAQLDGGGGNARGQNRVARFRRGNQVAHRADATDARHQRGHFVERPALAELFKAAELRHVKARIRNLSLLIELNCNFPVAFDAGHGIDNQRLLAHRFSLRHPSSSSVDIRSSAISQMSKLAS